MAAACPTAHYLAPSTFSSDHVGAVTFTQPVPNWPEPRETPGASFNLSKCQFEGRACLPFMVEDILLVKLTAAYMATYRLGNAKLRERSVKERSLASTAAGVAAASARFSTTSTAALCPLL